MKAFIEIVEGRYLQVLGHSCVHGNEIEYNGTDYTISGFLYPDGTVCSHPIRNREIARLAILCRRLTHHEVTHHEDGSIRIGKEALALPANSKVDLFNSKYEIVSYDDTYSVPVNNHVLAKTCILREV